MISDIFSENDLRRIRDAVTAAESQTSAEIIPYIVDRSDDYDDVPWRFGFFASLAVLGVFWILRTWTEIWSGLGLPEIIISVLVFSSGMIALARRWHSLTRLLVGAEKMNYRCGQRAREAFLSEEVFATRERTGILIFVSLLEHHVIILGDSGISRKVSAKEWESITEGVVRSMKEKKAAEGIIQAIRAGAHLLVAHGLAKSADDRNELHDRPRTGGR